MAAGSTDSFSATPQSLGCFNSDLLKTAWTSADVVATACTGGFWEDDPEEKVKKQINALKRKFHSGRQLLIKYLPRDVTEEDVRELLTDFPVQMVVLQTGAGSGSARVSLEDPEMLEDWDRERVFVLRGQRVPVVPAPTEMMLCVARLPPAFTEPQFAALVRSYGEVRRCFLMLSERTGASKGYGFVEYTMKETAMQAKSLLDGRQLDGCTLCCDWLDSNHVTFESLHSKCLYVDRLPPNFRDMGEFRKVFSSIVNPPYCQIALKNGCPQDWGLVEFSCAEDAELSRSAVDNVQLRGHSIRTAFYIPGVRAINLYLKLLNDSGNKSKGALLPDPPAPAVFQQLQNLAKQNPIFAQNLQNIILSQIQNLPQKSEPSVKTTVSPNSCASSVSSLSSSSSSSSGTSINIPPPPPLPRKAPQIIVPPPAPCATSTGKPSPTPNSSGNSQAALVVLLAAQMQMQMGNSPPSLLGNPQMLATLQNLLKQGSNSTMPSPFPPNHFHQGQSSMLPNHDKLQQNKNGINVMKNGYHKSASLSKVPLLPSPPTGVSPPPREVSPLEGHISVSPSEAANAAAISNLWSGLLGGQIMPNLSPQAMEQLLTSKPMMQDKMGYPSKPTELYAPLPQAPTDLQQHLGLLLSNPHNLNALLGTLVPPAFLAPQQQRQAAPTPEAAWGLPPSPPPPPAAWVPPMGSPMRPWAPGSFPTPSTSPIVFAGCPGLWATSAHAPVTPVGQKRKYNHILPSPEPSPEGNYIGQHSQGLGGHYADSYFKRKKKH